MFFLIATAALLSALMGGIFYAFSSFIMAALRRIPAPEGIRAMQRINVDVFHWSFMGLFFGIPLLSLGLGIWAFLQWSGAAETCVIAGAVVYVVGCFVVTAGGNVPLNNALEKVDADSENAPDEWTRYVRGWLRWNHVRTAACLVAAVLYGAGLVFG